MTVEALAQELGIAPSTLRNWLRKNYARDPSERGKPWSLTEEHIAAARVRWPAKEPVTAAVAGAPEPPASNGSAPPALEEEIEEPEAPASARRSRRPKQPKPLWLDAVGSEEQF